jgi:hypothetical protein
MMVFFDMVDGLGVAKPPFDFMVIVGKYFDESCSPAASPDNGYGHLLNRFSVANLQNLLPDDNFNLILVLENKSKCCVLF